MKINHNIIRDIIKWIGLTLFVISVVRKLKDIIKYGGTKKNKNIDADADDVYPVDDVDDVDDVDEKINSYECDTYECDTTSTMHEE